MPRSFRWTCFLLLFVGLVATGCESSLVAPDASDPESPATPVLSEAERTPEQSTDATFIAIANDLEGFGGAYFREDGLLNVFVTGPAAEASVDEIREIIEQYLGDLASQIQDPRLDLERAGDIERLEGAYDFRQLVEWREATWEVLEVAGVHTLDLDERLNRIRVGVEDAAAMMEASDVFAAADVPDEAVVYDEGPAPERMTTVRDRTRYLEGGWQIAYDNYLCTYGFTAYRNGYRGFVTNGHCSTDTSTITPTFYYQPTVTSGNYIGYEIANSLNGGSNYAYSDALFARVSTSDRKSLFTIARTEYWSYKTGAGSLTPQSGYPRIEIDGHRTSVSAGLLLDKVGRTSGWTFGPVQSTCQAVTIGTHTLYCQDEVHALSQGGDSGSPVFYWKGDTDGDGAENADLTGLLWGRRAYPDGTKTFLFSRINYVEMDLGPMTMY